MSTPSKVQAKAEPESSLLKGAEKVAILLLALGRPKAARLLKRFDAEEIRLITKAANDLPEVSGTDLSQLVEEFAKKFSGGVNFVGTANEVRTLLTDVMSEDELNAVLTERTEEGPPADEPVWAGFARLKDDALRDYLLGEHPQVAALILTRIDYSVSARIIGSLPPDFRNMLLWRMLGIKSVADDAIEAVERALRDDLVALTTSGNAGSHAGIAEILNRLDKTQSEEALRLLAEVRPADVRALRSMLFTFEDLPALSQKSLTVVLNQIPVDQLVTALSGTDQDFQAAVLSVLGARARRMLEAELQPGREAPAREVADVRRVIVDTVLKLNAQGQIELPQTDDQAA